MMKFHAMSPDLEEHLRSTITRLEVENARLQKLNGELVKTLNDYPALVNAGEARAVAAEAKLAVLRDAATVGYVARYGGRCRDCADFNGYCQGGKYPCDPDVVRAVISHTLSALAYGFEHGFLPLASLRDQIPEGEV